MAAKKNILLKFIAVCTFLVAGAFAIQAIVTLQFMPIMGEILFGVIGGLLLMASREPQRRGRKVEQKVSMETPTTVNIALQPNQLTEIVKAFQEHKKGIENDPKDADTYVWSFYRTVERILDKK